MRTYSPLLLVAALAGCAGYGTVSQQAPNAVLSVSRNYQAVYADLVRNMRTCLNPGVIGIFDTSSTTLDTDLYPDLGYGEIVYGLSAITPDTLSIIKVSKAGSGAQVAITVGNQTPFATAITVEWLTYWSTGGSECQKEFLGHPPAS